MDDIKEIKADVKELLQRSAVHNEILRTHESRSLALQAGQEKLDLRILPLEKHSSMMSGSLKFIGLLSILAAIAESVFVIIRGN